MNKTISIYPSICQPCVFKHPEYEMMTGYGRDAFKCELCGYISELAIVKPRLKGEKHG